jgi:hypothetical protein
MTVVDSKPPAGLPAAEKPGSDYAPRLGEELPLFCERCGYSFHGLPQVQCERCDIRHHRCPECGHSQPINTLRPAFQRILGRMRAAVLCGAVIARVFAIGLALFGWVGMGHEWVFRYNFSSAARGPGTVTLQVREQTGEWAMASIAFGVAFGAVCRLMLLRWRRSWAVGLVLAGLVVTAYVGGAYLRMAGRSAHWPNPWEGSFALVLLETAAAVVGAALLAWPVWRLLVRAFFPPHVAEPLLAWQSMRDADGPAAAARQ